MPNRLLIGLKIVLWVAVAGVVYLWLGPTIAYPVAGGFYSVQEVRFGVLGYFVIRREYAVYGYFVERQLLEFHTWRLAASLSLALVTLVIGSRLSRRLKREHDE